MARGICRRVLPSDPITDGECTYKCKCRCKPCRSNLPGMCGLDISRYSFSIFFCQIAVSPTRMKGDLYGRCRRNDVPEGYGGALVLRRGGPLMLKGDSDPCAAGGCITSSSSRTSNVHFIVHRSFALHWIYRSVFILYPLPSSRRYHPSESQLTMQSLHSQLLA